MAIGTDLLDIYRELNEIQRMIEPGPPIPEKKNVSFGELQAKLEAIFKKVQSSSSKNKGAGERILAIAKRLEKLSPKASGTWSNKVFQYLRGATLSAALRLLPPKDAYASIMPTLRNSLMDKGISKDSLDTLETLVERLQDKMAVQTASLGITKPEDITMLLKANIFQAFSNIVDAMNMTHANDPFILLSPFQTILPTICIDMEKADQKPEPFVSLKETYAEPLTNKILQIAFPLNEESFVIPPSFFGSAVKSAPVFAIIKTFLQANIIPTLLGHVDEALKRLAAEKGPSPETATPVAQPISAPPQQSLGASIFKALKLARRKDNKKLTALLAEKGELISTLSTQVSKIIVTVIPELAPLEKTIAKIASSYVKKYGSILIMEPSTIINAVLEGYAKVNTSPIPSSTATSKPSLKDPLDQALKTLFRAMGKRLPLFPEELKGQPLSLRIHKFISHLKWTIVYRTLGLFLPWFVRRQAKTKSIITVQARLEPRITRLKKSAGGYAEELAKGLLTEKK